MSDTTVTTDPPVLDLPPNPTQGNDPTARTLTGEIKDQSTPQEATSTTTPTDKTPAEPKDPAAPAVVPETYADFTLPEGLAIDPEVLKEATGIFKELGLTQDSAQKLVALYGKDVAKITSGPQTEFKSLVDGWRTDVLADKSLATGTELRADVSENIGKLKASLPAEDRKSFDNLMNMSGLGNHPTIVKALNAWGANLSEGKHVAGNGPSPLGQKSPDAPKKPSVAQAMFPNLP